MNLNELITPVTHPGIGKSVSALNFQTNYHEAGEGKAQKVILLHGSGPGVSAWSNWSRVLPVLANDFHVYAPDCAGFGFTEFKPEVEKYDIKLWVKHLLAFMDAVGIEKASLVGNSFGGSLSMAASLFKPERFERLVLMGTPCDQFSMTEGLKAGWYYTPSMENMEKVMRLFPYDQSIITPELIKARYEVSARPGAQEALRRLLHEPKPEGETTLSGMPVSAIKNIQQRTLILHGREDRVIPLEMALRSHGAIADSELHVFGKCGHWVQTERYEQFVSMTRDFFLR